VDVVSVEASVVPEARIRHDLVVPAQGPGRRSQGVGHAHIRPYLLVIAQTAPIVGQGVPALAGVPGPVA